LIGVAPAIVLSNLLFGVHHLVAVKAQAGWDIALLATLGVFIGGCIWGWAYWRYQSIWPGYISHIIADIAVFGVGYTILF
jgi:membrane protease YdiL (CAAX protease family)